MQLIASILGWVIVSGLLFSGANYFFKAINMKWINKLPKERVLRKRYPSFLQWYLRFHPLIGGLTAAAMVTHFILQYLNWGFFFSGLVAGSLVIVLAALGLYGNFIRHKKRGTWFYAHRIAAVLLIPAVVFHIAVALSIML